MLLSVTEWLAAAHSGFHVFQYLTLRAILGALTALAISLIVGPFVIRRLSRSRIEQTVRDDGPQSHLAKTGTPTMGGALILIAVTASTVFWADLANRFVWVVLLVTLLFGAIGWADDYRKLVRGDPRGLPATSTSGNRPSASPAPSFSITPRSCRSKPSSSSRFSRTSCSISAGGTWCSRTSSSWARATR